MNIKYCKNLYRKYVFVQMSVCKLDRMCGVTVGENMYMLGMCER